MAATMHFTHLAFCGPEKVTAQIEFGLGLNLIYGPSNTGKSSILDSIDFVLGRDRKLKELDEHEGYDTVLLGLSFSDGSQYTLQRPIGGGDLRCFEGLIYTVEQEMESIVLKPKRPTKTVGSLPDFIFEKINLQGKLLKKNARNEKDRLTLRNLSPYFIINETDIQKEVSPFLSGQHTKETVESSLLKFLTTGLDDGSLVTEEPEQQRLSREARLFLLSELVEDQSKKIAQAIPDGASQEDLLDQINRLDSALNSQARDLEQTEALYFERLETREAHRKTLETSQERQAEISEMLARFELLLKQYDTDKSRLENIIEAGTLFGALPATDNCPLCGSKLDNSDHHDCDEETSFVVEAGEAELQKIRRLEADLGRLVEQLASEQKDLKTALPNLREQAAEAHSRLMQLTPQLQEGRSQYSELISKKAEVGRNLSMFDDLIDLQERQRELEAEAPSTDETEDTGVAIPRRALFKLANAFKDLIDRWQLDDDPHVHFDREALDFVIDSKLRTSNGKGMRAITHAAATLALMKNSEQEELAHPGLVILDSPLLAYEDPEDDEDDLSDTHINTHFFRQLRNWNSRQVIVLENRKSVPLEFREGEQVTEFTKNSSVGRYGFFPAN